VENGKVAIKWKVVYTEDNDDSTSGKEMAEKGYTLPEYHFVAEYDGVESETGPVLEVARVQFQLIHEETSEFLAGQDYALADNENIVASGAADENGYIDFHDLKRGEFFVLAGVRNVRSDALPGEENREDFQLPYNLATTLTQHKTYRLELLIPRILDHYFRDQTQAVQQRLHRICHRPSIFEYLTTTIAGINNFEDGINAEIPRSATSIRIPTFAAFYSAVFQKINTTDNPEGRIRVDPQVGVLNNLGFSAELENIVLNPARSVAFTGLSENDSRERILNALHIFRIYTAPALQNPPMNDPEGAELNQHVPISIEVLEREFIGRSIYPTNNTTRRLNSETLLGINIALREDVGWERFPYYEKVNPVNNASRYYPRLGVRTIVNHYTQQQNPWGPRNIPRLQEQEPTMARYGCAVTFVANAGATHRERLIALGDLPENSANFTPETIIDNESNVPGIRYFDDNGSIFWAEPLKTLVQPLVAHYGNTARFHDNTGANTGLTANVFNNYMNDENRQYYIAIHIFITGNPGTRRGEHWVGVCELVTFPAGTVVTVTNPANGNASEAPLAVATQYYRISATSDRDNERGGAVNEGVTNNRGVRGWQFRQGEIYVPLTEVDAYRILQIPQHQ
jgi:hypothetical protein